MSARPWLWLCWFVLAFGVMNVYGPPDQDELPPVQNETHQQAAPHGGEPRSLPKSKWEKILNLARANEDVERYFAYANALLGRPYDPDFVRLTDEGKAIESTTVGDAVQPARPLRPWRDFLVEYPPGMLAPVVAPALLTSNFETYFFLFSLEMEAMLTIAVAFAVATAEAMAPKAGGRALGLSILLTAALGCISVRRYDPSVALAIAATVYGMMTRRPILASVFLAIGGALKGVPLLAAPVMLLWFAARRDWRGLATCAATLAICLGAVGVVYAATAGPHAWDLYAYHADRPLQVETPYGGALLLLRAYSPSLMWAEYSFGSNNVVSAAEPFLRRISGALEIVALLLVYALAYLRLRDPADDRSRRLATIWAVSACLVTFMSIGKVFSPQYVTWLLPLGAIAGATGGRGTIWRLVLANALTQADYPFLYATVGQHHPALAPLLGIVIVARTYALWSWIVALFLAMAASPSPAVDRPGQVQQAA